MAVAGGGEVARGYYEDGFETAGQFYRQFERAVADGVPEVAAFDLHQATERLHHCLLLTLTLYSLKSHTLSFLRAQAERLAPD
ncbi:hypothetical protein LRS10_19935 [Phenylobacterium sp. J426]|uniref:hypothetical protein n=1 Tax=Phenylobacterium sp. J426 TaxID=2898439 RepID=UPI0021514E97|nr:hypothetical protein [Phenylobacterium sp. J426]MCR5876212.1 hypothetical protein [Phenylobacterium sp. J426]